MQGGVGEYFCEFWERGEGVGEVAAVDDGVGGGWGGVVGLCGGDHVRGGVDAVDECAFCGELGGKDAVAAADVEDCVCGWGLVC